MVRFLIARLQVALFVLFVAASASAQDPSLSGPFTPLTASYDRGDTAFVCGVPQGCSGTVPNAEIRAEVYYPSQLTAGPFPLLVFLHGNHASCYRPSDGAVSPGWPCPAGFVSLPNHRGYDYIGRILASQGFIVASISANGINARSADSVGHGEGIIERARLIEAHLGLWNTFNTVGSPSDGGPFASAFRGRVNLDQVGTLGHSRGGDGVVRHFSTFNATSPFHVRAVLPIAPTNFARTVVNNVDLGVLLSYCDGDIGSLEGVLYYDDSRYNVPGDQSTKRTFLAVGGNHNFYNTVWTPECWQNQPSCWQDSRGTMPQFTVDDAAGTGQSFCDPAVPGNQRITAPTQRAAGVAYVAGFFRRHMQSQLAFEPILRGDVTPPAVDPRVHVGFHAPASQRLDLNRLNDASELSLTTLAGTGGQRGSVIANSLETFMRCGFNFGNPCWLGSSATHSHLANSSSIDGGLSRARLRWNEPADSFENQLPPGARNVSRFGVLQFRTALDFQDFANPNPGPLSFSVRLRDGSNTTEVSTSQQLGVNDLYFPQGGTNPPNITAKAIMNSLRVPLDRFTRVNLADLRSVDLHFNGTTTGTVLVSDVAFTSEPITVSCQSSQSFLVGDRASVEAAASAPGAVLNSGTTTTSIGADAHSGSILSVAPVQIADRAIVTGGITSANTITASPFATITGPTSPLGTVILPALPTLPAFPPPVGGNITINSGTTLTLAPGSRPSVTVTSGGTLILGAGDYFFTHLLINSNARIQVAPTTRVFVQTQVLFNASFVNASNAVQPIVFGFAGTALSLESRFDGVLIAPNAQTSLGAGAGLTFTGQFFSRIIDIRPQSRLVCTGGGSFVP